MFAKSLHIIIGLLGTATRSFALAAIAIGVGLEVVLSAIAFGIACQASTERGIVAAILASLVATVCTLAVALYYAALKVACKAVLDIGLGSTICAKLFDYTLGVAGEDPGANSPTAKIPTHMSRDEVQQALTDASKRILSDEPPKPKWAGPGYWLAKQILRISIWATVHVIVYACSRDGDSVNMYELRDRLASTIDERVVALLKRDFKRIAAIGIAVTCLVAVLLAFGIRYYSFS